MNTSLSIQTWLPGRCWRPALAGVILSMGLAAHATPKPAALRLDVALAELREAQRPVADIVAAHRGLLDDRARVLVEIIVERNASVDSMARAIAAMGLDVVSRLDTPEQGLLAVWWPAARLGQLPQLDGLRVARLARAARPARANSVTADRLRAAMNTASRAAISSGAAISQGVSLMRADLAQAAGADGAGITIGVISSSFDRYANAPTRAADDVASGDLPGPGNPRNTQPVVVLQDVPRVLANLFADDLGRGLLQLIHDVAPAARLCFTTGYTQALLTAAYQRLADKAGACGADVILDDLNFYSEPMFSDGPVSQAIERVAAAGVVVVSDAGEADSPGVYEADFRGVANEQARLNPQPVNLSLIPVADTAGGFHDFDPGPGTDIALQFTTTAGANGFLLYWNDLFDQNAITTDYDVYLFSADGQRLVARLTEDNRLTDQATELLVVPNGTYQVVIARADASPAQPVARRIHFDTGTGPDNLTASEYMGYGTPTLFGHDRARSTLVVGAVDWFAPFVPQFHAALGPATVWFADDGTRLATPEVRRKPEVAGPADVNLTSYGGDSSEDADVLPNMGNSRAAAAHVAGLAAMLLQRAGGPGSLSPTQVRALVQRGATPLTPNPTGVRAVASAGPVQVVLEGLGDDGEQSAQSPNTFRLRMSAPAGYSLVSATVDIAGANAQRQRLGVPAPGMFWNPAAHPFALGSLAGLAAEDVSVSPLSLTAPFSTALTLSFAEGRFTGGDGLSFGVDRAEAATGSNFGGNWMAHLIGGELRGEIRLPGGEIRSFTAPLRSEPASKRWAARTGYGLVDAVNSLQLLP